MNEAFTTPDVRLEMRVSAPGEPLRTPIGFSTEISDAKETGEEKHVTILTEASIDSSIKQLLAERHAIMNNDKLRTGERLKLLEDNRRTLIAIRGGTYHKTENVVYGILLFGALVLIVLSLLTVFAELPAEITLAFVGTVLGGTIATIAQKIGRI